MKAITPGLTMMALVLTACGESKPIQQPTVPSALVFSVSLRVIRASQPGDGQPSPFALDVTVRDGLGMGTPILGGAVAVRDSSGALLVEATIPNSESGLASVGLAWPQESTLGRSLELRISILDAAGTIHVLERTLAL